MDTLFVSDLDGTLLDQTARLSPWVRRRLACLLADGLRFTVATGRTPLSVGPIFQGLSLDIPWILMNGALLLSPQDGTVVEQVPLGEAALAGLVRAERELGLSGLLLGTADGRLRTTLGSRWTPLWQAFFCRNHVVSEHPPARQGRGEDWTGDRLLYGIYIHAQMAPLEALRGYLSAWGGFQVELYRDVYDPNTCCLELYSASASKGAAVRALRHLTGAGRLVAFGDSANDLSLFQACDECYAVENAALPVKAAAQGVIGSCTGGGVIRYLERRQACGGLV